MLARTTSPRRLQDAEQIAIEVFAYIAWRENEKQDFMDATGLEPRTIRDAAYTPSFLAGILDYVVGEPVVFQRIAGALRLSPMAIDAARRELLPTMIVSEAADPDAFGPGPLTLRCEHCGSEERVNRRRWPHLPARVATVSLPRGPACGGGFDQGETWLDAYENQITE